MAKLKKKNNLILDFAKKIKSLKKPTLKEIKTEAITLLEKLRTFPYKDFGGKIYKKVKGCNLKQLKNNKAVHKTAEILAGSGKFVVSAVVTFLFFYYLIGSSVVENIDVKTEYKSESAKTPTFETAKTMSFLIKREIDDKMWTPNLPMIFPAYALDNMPNFQKGIIAAVKNISSALCGFSKNTEAQQKSAEKAYELLSYAPDVWLMSRKGAFNLAPSSNSQYRKAAKELRVFSAKGIFTPNVHDFKLLLAEMDKGLQKSVRKNENQQLEHSDDWFDTKADNLFYYNKGYAFSLWQITKTLAADYKETLLQYNIYEDWTHLVAALEKAAVLRPKMVRNARADAVFAANHLLVQNSYLLKAVLAIQLIKENLPREENAD